MLSSRNVLATLIVAATALFVLGVSLESAESELESTPLIALVAAGSLGLALAAWLRPSEWLLALVAVAMLAFAVLDLAEVGHLAEGSEGGLVAIAVLVAALHLGAGWVAFSMRRQLVNPSV